MLIMMNINVVMIGRFVFTIKYLTLFICIVGYGICLM